jgi:hypothetical protein
MKLFNVFSFLQRAQFCGLRQTDQNRDSKHFWFIMVYYYRAAQRLCEVPLLGGAGVLVHMGAVRQDYFVPDGETQLAALYYGLLV